MIRARTERVELKDSYRSSRRQAIFGRNGELPRLLVPILLIMMKSIYRIGAGHRTLLYRVMVGEKQPELQLSEGQAH